MSTHPGTDAVVFNPFDDDTEGEDHEIATSAILAGLN